MALQIGQRLAALPLPNPNRATPQARGDQRAITTAEGHSLNGASVAERREEDPAESANSDGGVLGGRGEGQARG